MTLVNLEGHYRCELGDFYHIFAQNPRSWEFKAKGILKEEELAEALEILRMLKNGQMPERR